VENILKSGPPYVSHLPLCMLKAIKNEKSIFTNLQIFKRRGGLYRGEKKHERRLNNICMLKFK
jgi:hypothetical protein